MKSRGITSALPALPARIINLPRIVRIALVMAFSIGVTLFLVPVFYPIETLANPQTSTLPLVAAVGAGVIMYGIGWRLMIGYIGERPPVRPAVLLYCLAGVIILLLTLLLLIFGAVTGSQL